MLPNEKAILLIRGEKPVIDLKYDILKHPNVKYTADGNEKLMYEHGIVDKATAIISILDFEEIKDIKNIIDTNELKEDENSNYELLSEEDIENYIYMEEYENERKQENNKQNKNG